MEKNNVPKLRFPEFRGEWEEKKLGDISTITAGYAFKSELFSNKGFKLITPKNFTKEGRAVFTIENTKYTTEVVNAKFVCRPGDLLVLLTDLTSTCELLGKPILLNEDDGELLLNQRIVKIDLSADYSIPFLKQLLLTESYTDKIRETATGTTVKHSSNRIILSSLFNLPSLPEQQKIASFLSAVDKKIEQLQKKKELLEQYKKGMMQKLFSKEVRFKDDDGREFPEWEEKELGKVGFFQTSSIDKLLRDDENEVYLVNYMDVYKHKLITNINKIHLQRVTAKDSQIASNNLLKGDILFTPSSETPDDIGHSIVISEDLPDTVYSYHIIRFRPNLKLDLNYSHYFCNISSVLSQLSKYATGSTRYTISTGNFAKVRVQIPSLPEQTKIADFLTAIDNKISAVSAQVEKAKAFKKGLLQQMFV